MKYSVEIIYEMEIEADDEDQARDIADSAFKYYVTHPQTEDVIFADILVYTK